VKFFILEPKLITKYHLEKMKNKLLIFSCFFILAAIVSCKKGAGEGGNSSIHGYISVIKYDAFLTDTLVIYGGYDEDVYIIYGEDISYGDRIRSGPDGNFEFKYLREGKYKIYVYSEDTLPPGVKDSVPNKFPVMKDIEITQKNQDVDAGTFEIIKR
jgi:hypothetical protein